MSGIMFTLLLMIFLHIVDDFYLQGWLASGKQRGWWIENAPADQYKNDYIWCLIMHSFSWAFMIMIPVFVNCGFVLDGIVMLVFIGNVLLHAYVDNQKANVKVLNLWQDQIVHLLQIFLTWTIFFV